MYCYATLPPDNTSILSAAAADNGLLTFGQQQFSVYPGLQQPSYSVCPSSLGASVVAASAAGLGYSICSPPPPSLGPTAGLQRLRVPPIYSQQYTLLPADHLYISAAAAAGNKRSFEEDHLPHQSVPSSSMTSVNGPEISLTSVHPNDTLSYSEAKKVKLDGQSQQQQQQQSPMICKPSRVIHLRGIPADTVEGEIIQLGLPFGQMTNIVLSKKKNQALLEMLDVSSAQALVSFYNERPTQIRGRPIYVQFSNHEQLKTENMVKVSGPQTSDDVTHDSMQDGGVQSRNVLRVIVENLFCPVTIDTLKQIFSRYGQVLKIVTFNKNNMFQALIEYADSMTAHTAKASLNGQSVFHGCCHLRIDFSKLHTLNVRYNNEKSRDYTDPSLPSGDLTAFTYNGQPVTYAPGTILPTYATTVIPGLGPTAFAYCASPAAAQGFSYLQGSVPYSPQGGMLGVASTPTATAHVGGVRMSLQTNFNSVLLVTNLNEQIVTPDSLFTLFGVYGDVMRVKVMFNKKENALVQFADGNQAQLALIHLDKVKLWGRQIKVSPSRHTFVQMPKDGQQDAGLTKDYTNSTLHRFKKLYSKNYNNIYAPSATLHLSNIPSSTTEDQLVKIFAQHGTIVAFKFFETDHKMALMQMSSTEEAVVSLVELHNYQLAETSHLRVSFSKSTITPVAQLCEGEVTDNLTSHSTDSLST